MVLPRWGKTSCSSQSCSTKSKTNLFLYCYPWPDNSSTWCEPRSCNSEERGKEAADEGDLGHLQAAGHQGGQACQLSHLPHEQDHPSKPTNSQLCWLLQDRKQPSCFHKLQSSGKKKIQHRPEKLPQPSRCKTASPHKVGKSKIEKHRK